MLIVNLLIYMGFLHPCVLKDALCPLIYECICLFSQKIILHRSPYP